MKQQVDELYGVLGEERIEGHTRYVGCHEAALNLGDMARVAQDGLAGERPEAVVPERNTRRLAVGLRQVKERSLTVLAW